MADKHNANEWMTVSDIASLGLPGLPQSLSSIEKTAKAMWRRPDTARLVAGPTKPIWEYHVSVLPPEARAHLAILASKFEPEYSPEALWSNYEALSKAKKKACEVRFNALLEAEAMIQKGIRSTLAYTTAAENAGVSAATIYSWQAMVHGIARHDWLAALAPKVVTTAERDKCHPMAWSVLKSDYLRPEKPTFTACYRRMVKAAIENGWSPVPSEHSLRRRLQDEVPYSVQVTAREKKDKAKALYPAQRRTRSHLHAMEAVNMDGHKLDVFVRLENGTVTRLFLVCLQDLYSGKFVAWRLCESENKHATRLVIGDMIENHGIPDRITLDNGRAFASKWITGGISTRYRFKVRDEDPQGLLTTLNVEVQFTQPYSGQSKPIERAFLDLTDTIARHPICAGAYTGNKPDARPDNATQAVPIDEFRAHVDREIAEHNARPGRRGGNCKGRSFDQTFADSLAAPGTIVRRATTAQRALWLLTAEGIRARKGNGEIHLHDNRYWHPALTAHAGDRVIVRFDPDKLHEPLRVYDLDNELICQADCIDDTGFHDTQAARKHSQLRSAYLKAQRAEHDAHAALSARQLADLYSRAEAPKPQKSDPPKVTRMVIPKAPRPQISEDDFAESFSRGLARVMGGAVIEFPSNSGDEPVSSAYGSKKRGG